MNQAATLKITTSKLDPYREDIATMVRARTTQADILRYLAKEHGVSVSKSVLCEYIKRLSHPPDLAIASTKIPVSPEEERFFAQAEVFAELQAASQTLQNGLVDVVEAVRYSYQESSKALNAVLAATKEGFEQHRTLTERVTALESAIKAQRPIPQAPPPLSPPAPEVSAVLLRRIWKRAFFWSGVLWAVLIGTVCYLRGQA